MRCAPLHPRQRSQQIETAVLMPAPGDSHRVGRPTNTRLEHNFVRIERGKRRAREMLHALRREETLLRVDGNAVARARHEIRSARSLCGKVLS